MYYLGIDVGSLSCDAVIVDAEKKSIASSVVPTGANNKDAIELVYRKVLMNARIHENEIAFTVSTGYGRNRVDSRQAAVTEITCHARGIKALLPETRLLIDIGGQDSKAILLDENGRVVDFSMNDKCAAGTGRFLEAMARALQVDIGKLGVLDRGAVENRTLSSMCTVFAESEVVSLIADGIAVKEIAHGLNRSIASRTLGLVKQVAYDLNGLPVSMSGGVAHNQGVVRALSEALGYKISIPENPDTVGALGAALIARESESKF